MQAVADRRSAAARRGAEHRSEREEQARGEIDPAHGALWKKVGRGIKGTPHQRAERFKEYAEEHPREAIAALDDYADREVARMVREQERADRAAAMREIDAWRDLDEERERSELAPMPLIKSKSSRARSANIRELIHAGKPAKQAAAIAYKVQREAEKRGRSRAKKRPRGKVLISHEPSASVQHMAKRRRTRRAKSHSLAVRRAAPATRHRGRTSSAKSVGKNLLAIVGAPAALALAENAGISIPTIGAAGEAGTLGLIGYGLHYFGIVRSPMLRDAAIGLLGVAAYQGIKQSGLGKSAAAHGVDGYDAGYPAD